MKIVIDVPEKLICEGFERPFTEEEKNILIKAIGNGTPFYKIIVEIEQTTSRYTICRDRGAVGQVEWSDRLIKESEVLAILDKYKTERIDKG